MLLYNQKEGARVSLFPCRKRKERGKDLLLDVTTRNNGPGVDSCPGLGGKAILDVFAGSGDAPLQQELLALMTARRGHFRLESGHHGDLWLDLEALFLRPHLLRPFVRELAQRLKLHGPEAVCGPITGGAFLAQMLAEELEVEYFFAERSGSPQSDTLFTVQYHIPKTLHHRLQGKRAAVVDDVINAGSAVRGTLTALEACGAIPVALGALLILGEAAANLAATKRLPLESLAHLPNTLWEPSACPLCASPVPLDGP